MGYGSSENPIHGGPVQSYCTSIPRKDNQMSKQNLFKLLEEENRYPHLEHHDIRKDFFETILDRYGIDPEFDELVDGVFDLFVDGKCRPHTFYEIANDPYCKIRNILIVWNIDHY